MVNDIYKYSNKIVYIVEYIVYVVISGQTYMYNGVSENFPDTLGHFCCLNKHL